MNIFTKTIISATILASYSVEAQNQSVEFINIPTTVNYNYEFNGYWGIYDDKDSNYKITGAKLINNSSKTSENLYLDLFLVPQNESIDLNNLPNRITTNAKIGKLEPNGTSFNNVVVSIKNTDIEKQSLYKYIPVLVLKDMETGNILNYKVLNNNINGVKKTEYTVVKDNSTTQNTSTTTSNVNVFDPIPTATPEFSKFNPYVVAESNLDLYNINKEIKLPGDWKLEIDFEKMTVSVDGENNSIDNYKLSNSNKLILMIYLSKENINKDKMINGYDFVSFELDPIAGSTRLVSPKFHDNITKLAPAGEYYPLLVLKELNTEKGEYLIKSAVRIGDAVSF
ncbi:hypothetical protein [Chishuiella changwenlii]|jgi:hypothetical protein|uniref:hypothetical protein n=1 Tax=Chishuiella changwenlii TaxID=1434701 RepID=UPI002FD9C530